MCLASQFQLSCSYKDPLRAQAKTEAERCRQANTLAIFGEELCSVREQRERAHFLPFCPFLGTGISSVQAGGVGSAGLSAIYRESCLGFCLLCWLIFVNVTQTRVTWEKDDSQLRNDSIRLPCWVAPWAAPILNKAVSSIPSVASASAPPPRSCSGSPQ